MAAPGGHNISRSGIAASAASKLRSDPRVRRMAATTKRRRMLFGIVAVVVLALAAMEAVKAARNYRLREVANSELNQAERNTPASATYQDARHWLEQHGYKVLHWNPHDPEAGSIGYGRHIADGVKRDYKVVSGYRMIAPKSLLNEDRWINLDFLFTTDGKIYDIRLDHRAVPPRTLRDQHERNSHAPAKP